MAQRLRLHSPNTEGTGSVPDQGTKIPKAAQHGRKKGKGHKTGRSSHHNQSSDGQNVCGGLCPYVHFSPQNLSTMAPFQDEDTEAQRGEGLPQLEAVTRESELWTSNSQAPTGGAQRPTPALKDQVVSGLTAQATGRKEVSRSAG